MNPPRNITPVTLKNWLISEMSSRLACEVARPTPRGKLRQTCFWRFITLVGASRDLENPSAANIDESLQGQQLCCLGIPLQKADDAEELHRPSAKRLLNAQQQNGFDHEFKIDDRIDSGTNRRRKRALR